jgi:DNA helicase HerA-like ATPase
MLAHDVLPCFCAVLGRVLLDLRSRTESGKRTQQPFVLVLEEAHNYLRPPRQEELWGVRLSRDAFERISKEGRKFGLSLIIASQRPSDVSATVLSQCANFLIHRIQNPEDIDYFKKILPLGSRDLLEQLPILAPGEGLLMGSAVNVPTRLKVRKPDPSPESETSRPWESWQEGQPTFDTVEALSRWVAEAAPSPPLPEESAGTVENSVPAGDYSATDDDVPF